MSRLPRLSDRTAIMGILNVTPDSFSDGGSFLSPQDALDRAREMIDEGADVIDVGGESTRPNATEVSVDVEMSRVVPVIEAIAKLGVPVSVDTRKSVVAHAALQAGAVAVNDVSGGLHDPYILDVVAAADAEFIAMHIRGTPADMDFLTSYGDVVTDVGAELAQRVEAARTAGASPNRIWLDPGLGFAKTPEQSLALIARIDELRALGHPLVVGPSRKRFIGHVTGGDADDRLEGTAAAVAWLAAAGVEMVRVHDVRAMRRVVEMTAAIGRGKR